jgi:dihydrofolate reductase
MGIVLIDMAVSLDGYVAGIDAADASIHRWYFEPTNVDRQVQDELLRNTGAIIIGARTYREGDQYDAFVDYPYPVENFVLTHEIPVTPAKGDTRFTFVTDGIHNALAQAQAAAGQRDVVIGGGAHIAQQYLQAGLVDVIQLHLAPWLVGVGLRLFDNLGSTPLQLETERVLQSPLATHLKYRVVR